MKKKCRYDNYLLASVFWLLGIFSFIACKEKPAGSVAGEQMQAAIYYCPMHPEVQQDHPGKCPKCMMDLILKTSDTLLGKVLKPVNSSVLTVIKTFKPMFHKMNADVESDGYIDYDSRTEYSISSLYSGRIGKLYIKYPYQPIRKGEKVFEIYSPELVTAQENLIYILQNDSGETSLINAAMQKLKLLGVTDNLLDEIVKTKKVKQEIPVYSPFEGHAHTNMKTSTVEMNQMNVQKQNVGKAEELSVKEGMYVMMGETVFNIIDAHNVAVILQIRPEEISRVKIGADVEIKINDNTGMIMSGKIDFIEPTLKEGFKTVSARVYIDNSNHNHKVGSLVKAKIKVNEMEALWIPLSALVDLGKEKIVWVKTNGHFIARKVETGIMSGSMIEVSDGLTEEDEIAAEAHYLTDSEGFVKESENEN
jgi:Cu(I)/Ag(I) efflux system membrane fusion protein